MNKLIILICFTIYFSAISIAHPGIGIVMDNQGNVFYTDLIHVWKINTTGDRSIAVKNVHTHELYIDSGDNLYGEHVWYEGEATDKWGNYVWCLGKDGVLKKIIPDVEGFIDNNTLVRDAENNSYWIKKSKHFEILVKRDASGQNWLFTRHKFKDIRWMYFSKGDNCLYVVDYLSIKKVAVSGKVTVLADDLKEDKPSFQDVADHHYIYGVWTDKSENVYVAVLGVGKIKKINPKGEITTVFESQIGWSPCNGLLAPDGVLWVLEFSEQNKTRVRKINPNGKHEVFGD